VQKELSDVYRCINLLSMHEKRWQQAGRFCDILKEIIRISHFQHENTQLNRLADSRSVKRSREAAPETINPESDSNSVSSSYPVAERRFSGRQQVPVATAGNSGLEPRVLAREMQQPSSPLHSESSAADISESRMDFTLPTHSSELGSLPVYESFADWPMRDWSFSFTTPPTLSGFDVQPQPQPVWTLSEESTPPVHPMAMNLFSSASPEAVIDSALLSHNTLMFDGTGANQDLFHSSPREPFMKLDATHPHYGLGDASVHEGHDANLNTSATKVKGWDDWDSYIASVDEVLQSVQRR